MKSLSIWGPILRGPFAKVRVSDGGRLFVCKFSAVHKDNDFSDITGVERTHNL